MSEDYRRAIDNLGLQDKIAGVPIMDWRGYFLALPQAILELSRFVAGAQAGLSPHHLMVLEAWLKLQGVGVERTGHYRCETDEVLDTLGLKRPDEETLWVLRASRQAPAGTRLGPDDFQSMRQAEARWFDQGQYAPVAVATAALGPQGSVSCFTWDCTDAFRTLDLPQRRVSFEAGHRDNDRFLQGRLVPWEVRHWQGQRSISVDLWQPSARLACLRHALALDGDLDRDPIPLGVRHRL